jgi:hypothetical protein
MASKLKAAGGSIRYPEFSLNTEDVTKDNVSALAKLGTRNEQLPR